RGHEPARRCSWKNREVCSCRTERSMSRSLSLLSKKVHRAVRRTAALRFSPEEDIFMPLFPSSITRTLVPAAAPKAPTRAQWPLNASCGVAPWVLLASFGWGCSSREPREQDESGLATLAVRSDADTGRVARGLRVPPNLHAEPLHTCSRGASGWQCFGLD